MTTVLDLVKPLMFEPRLVVLTILLMLAVTIDIREHRIPNLLVLVGLCFGLLYNGLYPSAVQENGWLLG